MISFPTEEYFKYFYRYLTKPWDVVDPTPRSYGGRYGRPGMRGKSVMNDNQNNGDKWGQIVPKMKGDDNER